VQNFAIAIIKFFAEDISMVRNELSQKFMDGANSWCDIAPGTAEGRRIRVVIFGATGSVGTGALNVIRRWMDCVELVGISARTNVEKLAQIAREFSVKNVGIFDEMAFDGQASLFADGTKFFVGEGGLCELGQLPNVDAVLMAIDGIAGLKATIAAIKAGKTILLASKEILVVAGKFVSECAKKNGVNLLPVDSEHNAIFQCLFGNDRKFVDRLILTASGGPFREFSAKAMESITVEQALVHPTWRMGKKITVDSATMANKGLEIVEARWLFDVPVERIDVLVHPESVIHSMVQFCDGSVISQACPPNMEFPIANCLFFPERKRSLIPTVDFAALGSLTFSQPDCGKFPSLSIARQCLGAGGNACAVFHGANEVAVEKFLAGSIKFTEIPAIIAGTLDAYSGEMDESLEGAIASVGNARSIAETISSKTKAAPLSHCGRTEFHAGA
jgi:1-deoxy-D-xylulose-5-phosphate reductoisomerase